MSSFDWGSLREVALRDLRLLPVDFWKLTPAEFAVMVGRSGHVSAMGRAKLDELMGLYPDK